MSGRHSSSGRPWWLEAGARVWVSFKLVTFVTGLLFYLLLIDIIV